MPVPPFAMRMLMLTNGVSLLIDVVSAWVDPRIRYS